MVNTPEQAIAKATALINGPKFGTGLCLREVRTCYGVPALAPDAAAAWANAKLKHRTSDPNSIPRGVPVFWTGGSAGHGHIAISLGNGYCLSTDILRPGYFDKVPIDRIRTAWGLTLVGWTEDLNNVRVWTKPAATEEKPVTTPVKTYGTTVGDMFAQIRSLANQILAPGAASPGTLNYTAAWTIRTIASKRATKG